MIFYLVLLCLGLIGGFFSGLLGLGGAMIMVIILYVPPLLHLTVLNMKVVAAVSEYTGLCQRSYPVLFFIVKREWLVFLVLLYMGLPSAIAGLLGALFSKQVNAHFLLTIFACISTLATLLMFIPKKEQTGQSQEILNADEVKFNHPLAAFISCHNWFYWGNDRCAWSIYLYPSFAYILKIPMRVTIGSTLGIVLMTAFTSSVGKIASGQMHWLIAGVLIVGSVTAAQLGSRASHHVPVKLLHKAMTVIIAFSSLKIWLDVLH